MGYLPSARREVFFSENSREDRLARALDQMLGELGGVFPAWPRNWPGPS